MARIAGVDLPRDKRIEIGLTYIFGIGRKSANDILAATGVNPDIRVRDLTEDDVSKLREYIDHNYTVEGDLRRDVAFDIKRLIEIGSYRGLRHRKGLPVRGQRTKTNARTRKGPRRRPSPTRRNKEEVEEWLLLKLLRARAATRRRKERKNIERGAAHIQSTFNNTIVTITDTQGNALSWASAGELGFRGSRKSTPLPLRRRCGNRRPRGDGARPEDRGGVCKGPGAGREAAIRALQAAGLEVNHD